MLNNNTKLIASLARGTIGASLLVGAAVLAFSGTSDASGSPLEAPPRPVRVAPVVERELEVTHQIWAVARHTDRATLGFTIAGRIQEVRVEVGARVRRGEVLAAIDARAYRHGLRSASAALDAHEAELAQLERDGARAASLAGSGVAPLEVAERAQSGADRARAGRDSASAQLAETRRLLSEAVLRAPFDAVVVAVSAREGEIAAPGAPMISVVGDAGPLEIEADLPDRHARSLWEGAQVEVLDDRGAAHPARLLGVAASTGATELVRARFAVDDTEAFGGGQTVELLLHTPGRLAVMVPVDALLDPSGHRPHVYRVQDGVAQRVDVTLGEVDESGVEVRSGLATGDEVVVAGRALLLDREAVQIERAPAALSPRGRP